MSNLVTLAELAEHFQITEAEAEALRRRHRWPHIKVGRKNVRFTPAQVELIERQHLAGGPAPTTIKTTARSAARSS